MACDDMVLAQTASPRAYASFLISFAEKLQNARGLALAQALVSRMHRCRCAWRKFSMQNGRAVPGFGSRFWELSAGLLALVFGAAPYVPRLVAFQNQPKPRQTQQIQATQQATDANRSRRPQTRHESHMAARDPQRSNPAQRPRAIPAAFNPRTAVVPLRLKATSARKPVVMRARATQRTASDSRRHSSFCKPRSMTLPVLGFGLCAFGE